MARVWKRWRASAMKHWQHIRDAVMLITGLGILYYQVMITHAPSLIVLLIGFGLIGLPSSLFAERMLSGDKAED